MKMKYSVYTVVLVLSAMMTSPAYALFTNGGFEDGNLGGWTIEYGNVASTSTNSPAWGSFSSVRPYSSAYPYAKVVTSSTVYPGQTVGSTYFDVNPYNGTYMAMINDIYGDYDATRISQTAALAADDIGDTVYINWGAMLVNPAGHGTADQPFFRIQILKNGGVIDTFSKYGVDAAQAGSGWTHVGYQPGWSDKLYYFADQYTYDLAGWNIGDSLTVSMMVVDCGASAHGGYAFLDGIGTDYVKPPNGVPEPSTMLLLMAGLLGTGIMRKKLAK